MNEYKSFVCLLVFFFWRMGVGCGFDVVSMKWVADWCIMMLPPPQETSPKSLEFNQN